MNPSRISIATNHIMRQRIAVAIVTVAVIAAAADGPEAEADDIVAAPETVVVGTAAIMVGTAVDADILF
jgi:hypothetical protein